MHRIELYSWYVHLFICFGCTIPMVIHAPIVICHICIIIAWHIKLHHNTIPFLSLLVPVVGTPLTQEWGGAGENDSDEEKNADQLAPLGQISYADQRRSGVPSWE